jgi:hypothetical protein
MNVHPSAGVNPEGPTTDEPFATEAVYEFKIDTNGDAIADIAYRIRFSSSPDGAQTAIVRRIEGVQAAGMGDDGETIIEGAPVSMGRDAQVTETGDYRFFAGWRSDSFFFDTMGALNNMQFTGHDFFTEADVCSVVLEVPNSALGTGKSACGIARSTVQAANGFRPTVGHCHPNLYSLQGRGRATISPGSQRTMLGSCPSSRTRLSTLVDTRTEEATRVAGTLLPDILVYDPSRPAAYPHNGRALSDDVMDGFISILTNGKVTRDNVGPHTDLLTSFPYLGAPHKDRSAKRVAA